MKLTYSMQRAVVVGILALVSIAAVAQENRSEISIQGTGFFTKDTAGNGVFERANETGGFLLGYRYNFNRWLAAEANYGYTATDNSISVAHRPASSPISTNSLAQQ